jgi:hypothetical protein
VKKNDTVKVDIKLFEQNDQIKLFKAQTGREAEKYPTR